MSRNAEVITLLADRDIAVDFYNALSNMQWSKNMVLPEEDLIIEKLMGVDTTIWSASWRSAGAIIADIRTKHYNLYEDYMDYYCSGGEGQVTNLVRDCFDKMGWKPKEWDRV
jgi:hypothetical protein